MSLHLCIFGIFPLVEHIYSLYLLLHTVYFYNSFTLIVFVYII